MKLHNTLPATDIQPTSFMPYYSCGGEFRGNVTLSSGVKVGLSRRPEGLFVGKFVNPLSWTSARVLDTREHR